MRSEDVERYRGRWVAVRRSDEVVLANAECLEALQEALKEHEHPQVLIRRIPALEDPMVVSLARPRIPLCPRNLCGRSAGPAGLDDRRPSHWQLRVLDYEPGSIERIGDAFPLTGWTLDPDGNDRIPGGPVMERQPHQCLDRRVVDDHLARRTAQAQAAASAKQETEAQRQDNELPSTAELAPRHQRLEEPRAEATSASWA